MLHMGSALPIRDHQSAKNVFNLGADLNLGVIGDKFGRCTMTPDIVLKRVDELFVSLHTLNIGDE
jgi:hypothetical protein